MLKNSNDQFPELSGETLIPLTQARAAFPVPVSASTIQRFWREGVRGNKLRTFLIFGRRYTSVQQIRAFVERSLNADDDVEAPANPLERRNDGTVTE